MLVGSMLVGGLLSWTLVWRARCELDRLDSFGGLQHAMWISGYRASVELC